MKNKIYRIKQKEMSLAQVQHASGMWSWHLWTEQDRLGDGCDKCHGTKWILLPQVKGQKRYIFCLGCYSVSHL